MDHQPRKRFGQNFLVDDSVVDRIVAAVNPRPDQRIVEIGPGLGAMTGSLLKRAGRLDVIELDRDLAAALPDRLNHPEGLVVHPADALKFDFTELAGSEPLRVVGNLPYNISTPLLFHLLDHSDVIRDMHFMLQKEVVDRITAEPGSKAWGRLGVMTAARAEAQQLFAVPPGAFRPAPKVDSAIVRIIPRQLSDEQRALLPALETVVRHAFSMRRKTLRNTLKGVLTPETLEANHINPTRRAETLSLEEFSRLAKILVAGDSTGSKK